MNIVSQPIENYLCESTSPESHKLTYLSEETHAATKAPHMLSGHVQGKFLAMLVSISNAKNIVEIGTFTGYATLAMAEASRDDAKILTLDINEDHLAIAKKHFANNSHGHKIEYKLGPALESIKEINGEIDLAFIDAEKSGYPDYFSALLPKMKIGGLMVFDNMLYRGEVLSPHNKTTRSIALTNKLITENPHVENVLIPLRDGLQLARRVS